MGFGLGAILVGVVVFFLISARGGGGGWSNGGGYFPGGGGDYRGGAAVHGAVVVAVSAAGAHPIHGEILALVKTCVHAALALAFDIFCGGVGRH